MVWWQQQKPNDASISDDFSEKTKRLSLEKKHGESRECKAQQRKSLPQNVTTETSRGGRFQDLTKTAPNHIHHHFSLADLELFDDSPPTSRKGGRIEGPSEKLVLKIHCSNQDTT